MHKSIVSLLHALVLLTTAVARPTCPKKSDLLRCTAAHKHIFNELLTVHGSLLGGVPISELHSLCSSYHDALSCMRRLESNCPRNQSRLAKHPLHNISALCSDRAAVIETYSLHHDSCFLKPPVKKVISECWDDFEASVGAGHKLTPKGDLYALSATRSAPSNVTNAATATQTAAAVCRLYSCLENSVDSSCLPGAKPLVASLALPLPPFNNLQPHSVNCSLLLSDTSQVSLDQGARLRPSRKQSVTQRDDKNNRLDSAKNAKAGFLSSTGTSSLHNWVALWWQVALTTIMVTKWL